MNKQGIVYTVLFAFLVSFVFVLLLASADHLTKVRVEENRTIAIRRAILNALALPSATPEEVERNFETVETIERGDTRIYRTVIDGRPVVAKEFSGSGLWGTITGILGVTADLQRTTGIEIIAQNETPGLGARIGEDWFKKQLVNERIVDGRIRVGSAGDGDYDPENGIIDAVTGASRTSDAIGVILDTELKTLSELIGGNQ